MEGLMGNQLYKGEFPAMFDASESPEPNLCIPLRMWVVLSGKLTV
jgi:hypothetical protein